MYSFQHYLTVYAEDCESFDLSGFFTLPLDNKENNKAPKFKRLWTIAYKYITYNVKGSANEKKIALTKKALQSFKTSYWIVRPVIGFDTLQVLSAVLS